MLFLRLICSSILLGSDNNRMQRASLGNATARSSIIGDRLPDSHDSHWLATAPPEFGLED
jgi:hypothetical protein